MRYLINGGVINNMMRMLLVAVLLLGMAGTVSACLAGHTCIQKCFIVTSQDGGIKIPGATVTMRWYSLAQDATVVGTTDSNGKVCLDGTKLVNEVDRNYRLEVVAVNYITYSVPFEGSDWINVADLGPTDSEFSVFLMSLPKDSNGLYDGVACTVGHPEFKTYCVYPARIPMNQYDVYIKYIWDGQEKVNWLSTLNAQAGWLPYGIDKIYCLQGDVNDYFACLGGAPPKKSIQFKVEYYNKDLLCRYTGWCSTGQFSSKIWSTTFTSADCYKDSDCTTGQTCDLTFKRCVSVVTPYLVNPKSIFTMIDKPAIYAKPDSPKVCKSASTAFYTCSRYSNSEFYFTVTRKKTIESNWFTPIDLQQGFDIQDAFEDICSWSLRLSDRPAYDTCLKNNILPFTFDFKVDIYVVGYGGIFKKVSTMDQKSVKIEHCDDTNVDRQCHLETCDDIGGICAVTSCIGKYCTSDSDCSKCTYGCGGGRINTKCFDSKCEPVAQCCNFDDDCSCNTKSGCNTKNIYHDTSADYTKPHYCGQRADYFKITRDWQSGQTTPYNPVVSYCRVGGDEAALCSKSSDCVSGICTGGQSSTTCIFRDPKILGSMNYCFTSSGGQNYVDGYCYKVGGGSNGPMISQCNTCTINSDCLACSYYCAGSQVDPSTLVCSGGKCQPASGSCLGNCYTEGICLKSGGQLIPCNYEVGTPNNKDSYCQNYLPKGYYSYCTAKLESNFHSDLTRGFCQHGKLADGQPCARPSWCISEKCPISDPETIMGTCGGGCHADGYKIETGENINDCCSKKPDGSPITTECPDEFNVRHIYCGNVNCESACKPAGYKLDQGEDPGVVCCVDPATSTRHAVDCYGVNYCAGTGFGCGATTTTTTTTLPGGGYCDFDACKDYVTATPGIGDGFAKAKAEPNGVLDIYGRGQPVTDSDGNYIHGQNGELIYNGCGCNPQSDTDAGIDRYYCAPNPNIEPGKSGVCKELRKDGETCGRGGDQTASYGDWVCRSFNCIGDVLNPDSKDVKCQSETFMCSANAGYGSIRDPEYYCHCEVTDKDRPNIDVGGRDGDEAGVCATIYAPDLTEDQIRGNLASSSRWCFSQDLGTYNPGGSQNTPDNKCKAKYQPGETCGADYQCVTGSCMDHICTDYTFSKTKVLGEGCHIINKLNGQTSYTIWNRLDNGEDKGVVLWDDDCNDDTSDGSLYCDACSTTGRVYGSISNGLPVESDIKCSDYDVPHMGVGICKRTQLESKWCYAHTQCNSDVHQMTDGIKEVLVCTSSSTYGFDCSRDNYYCTAGQTEKANKYCAFRPVKPCIHDEKEPLDKFDQKSDETCYNLQQLGELVSDKDLFCSDEHMCTLPGSDDMKECEKFTKEQRPNVVHSFGECVANYCEKKPEPFISTECMRAPGYWSTTGSNPSDHHHVAPTFDTNAESLVYCDGNGGKLGSSTEGGLCRWRKEQSDKCTYDIECMNGLYCQSGVCDRKRCRKDADCPDGTYTCLNSRCYKKGVYGIVVKAQNGLQKPQNSPVAEQIFYDYVVSCNKRDYLFNYTANIALRMKYAVAGGGEKWFGDSEALSAPSGVGEIPELCTNDLVYNSNPSGYNIVQVDFHPYVSNVPDNVISKKVMVLARSLSLRVEKCNLGNYDSWCTSAYKDVKDSFILAQNNTWKSGNVNKENKRLISCSGGKNAGGIYENVLDPRTEGVDFTEFARINNWSANKYYMCYDQWGSVAEGTVLVNPAEAIFNWNPDAKTRMFLILVVLIGIPTLSLAFSFRTKKG